MPSIDMYAFNSMDNEANLSTVVFKNLDHYRYALRINAYLRRVLKVVGQCHETLENHKTKDFIEGRMNDIVLTLLRYHMLSVKLSFEIPRADLKYINGIFGLSKFTGSRAERKAQVFDVSDIKNVIFINDDTIKRLQKILPRQVLLFSKVGTVSFNEEAKVTIKDIGPKKTRYTIKLPSSIRSSLGQPFHPNQSAAAHYFGNSDEMKRRLTAGNGWHSNIDKFSGITPRDIDLNGRLSLGIEDIDRRNGRLGLGLKDTSRYKNGLSLNVSIPTCSNCDVTKECLEKFQIIAKLSGRITPLQKINILHTELGITTTEFIACEGTTNCL